VSQQVQSIASQRNALASQIEAVLEGVAFGHRRFDEEQAERLIAQSKALLEQADDLGPDD
jgi:hypothetical protein